MPDAEEILNAIGQVEHPAIAASLTHLGLVKNVNIDDEGAVSYTLNLPFTAIPENIRDAMVTGVSQAVEAKGGTVVSVQFGVMNDTERADFMEKEAANWRS